MDFIALIESFHLLFYVGLMFILSQLGGNLAGQILHLAWRWG